MVNDDYRILWDFSIETDHAIEARRPDMIVEDRRNRQCKIIDFAVPYDNRVDNKEAEKIDKYQDLAREIKKTMEHASENHPSSSWCTWHHAKAATEETKKHRNRDPYCGLAKKSILFSATILKKVLEV